MISRPSSAPTVTWRLGPLTGRSTKPVAQYVGANARAAERARRLAELDARIAALAATRDAARALFDVPLAGLAGQCRALAVAVHSRRDTVVLTAALVTAIAACCYSAIATTPSSPS